MEEKNFDKIKTAIEEAEMILVGIGDEFSPVWEKDTSHGEEAGKEASPENGPEAVHGEENLLQECERSLFYENIPQDHEVMQAYKKLRELIGARPYFAVTMNTDDLIWRSALENDRIVAPCGSMAKMQCGEHIIPAAEIRDAVLAQAAGKSCCGTEEAVKTGAAQPLCPECGRPLSFHTVSHPGYMEEGYLPQWEKYTKWLQCTLNHRLCILELGVGFRYPQVVRFPFERTAFFNKKATLIRISSKFPQLSEELAQKGISVRQNPVDFLLQI
jgi:NAD-dependent SIR2 family protein deacetylase